MATYSFFMVNRGLDNRVHAAIQKERNTIEQGRLTEKSNWSIAASEDGICINGDYGVNPSDSEMRELAQLLKDILATYEYLKNGGAS